MNSLVEFWSKMPTEGPIFIHPEDETYLRQNHQKYLPLKHENFDGFIRGPSFGKSERRFHFSLFPSPYCGDLAKADIFILLLNPGFSPIDYYAEQSHKPVRKLQIQDLKQALDGRAFPNYTFDPKLMWTGAYQWWERKFRPIANQLVEQRSDIDTYRCALRELSQRVAAIEMVPYHSQSFGGAKLLKNLPSAKEARRFVKDELAPRARHGKITLVITRQVDRWIEGWAGQSKHDNIVKYEGGHARSASLGTNTKGGQAILRQLGLDIPQPKAGR